MSRLQIIHVQAIYLRELEKHLAVAAGKRKRDLQIRLRSARSKLQILLRQSE